MSLFPATCKKCGELFAGRAVGPVGSSVSLHKCEFDACPLCRSRGRLASDLYWALTHTAHVCAIGYVQPDKIRRFVAILQSALRDIIGAGDISGRIRSEVPELSKVAERLPAEAKPLKTWLTMLAAVGVVFDETYAAGRLSPITDKTQATDFIGEVVERAYGREAAAPNASPQSTSAASHRARRVASPIPRAGSSGGRAVGGAAAKKQRARPPKEHKAKQKRKRAHSKKSKRMSRKR